MVAQGYGSISAGPVTAGPVAIVGPVLQQGRVAVPAAGTSVVVAHNNVTSESHVYAVIAQTTADATATSVVRIVPANGSFTIFVNAAATAVTTIDWTLLTPSGDTATN